MPEPLKAPFPYFGGKSKVAQVVWRYLGNPDNVIEPFFGSGAVLLLRHDPPKVETVNDLDCYVANFWRATQHDPDAVAAFADGPVNEADLHSRHRWLVLSDDAESFRQRMRQDPDYFDPKVAGWWCWGLCCWIGSGWCDASQLERHTNATPDLSGPFNSGQGMAIHSLSSQMPAAQKTLAGMDAGQTDVPSRRPATNHCPNGVHRRSVSGELPLKRAVSAGEYGDGKGVNNTNHLTAGRPQLADAYDVGRGIHASPPEQLPLLRANQSGFTGAGVTMEVRHVGACDARREWITDWFRRLRDRLRNVRVCCGDWLRVCSSESVTTRLGVTGVFLDPPYGAKAKRSKKLYSTDSLTVADQVRAWCLERGSDPLMRIVLCGYEGEGHEALEAAGWRVESWKAHGGYGNRTEEGKANARKERLWVSPHCLTQPSLFAEDVP